MAWAPRDDPDILRTSTFRRCILERRPGYSYGAFFNTMGKSVVSDSTLDNVQNSLQSPAFYHRTLVHPRTISKDLLPTYSM